MKSRKQEANIFSGTDSSVMGLKLDGSSTLSFLWIKIVHAFFHSFGISPESHITRKISVSLLRR